MSEAYVSREYTSLVAPDRDELHKQLYHVRVDTSVELRPVVSFEIPTPFIDDGRRRTAIVSGYITAGEEHGDIWDVEGFIPEDAEVIVDGGPSPVQSVGITFLRDLMRFRGIIDVSARTAVLRSNVSPR